MSRSSTRTATRAARTALALLVAVGLSQGLATTSITSGQRALAATLPVKVTQPVKASADPNGDPVIAAAGDIACNSQDEAAAVAVGDTMQCQELKTAALLQDPSIDGVLALGDDQYYNGDLAQFSLMYGRSWGTVLSKTYPVPGNHEYYGPDGTANDYFAYFGARAGTPGKGWYSFNIGQWHVIALNTGDCSKIGGCSPAFSGRPASEQYSWLVNDLAQHPNQCILAYWHHPVFSGGLEGGSRGLAGFYSALFNAQADVVLNGHDHDYERFAQMDSSGNPAPGRGVREFVVGTGGRSQEDFATTPSTTEARFNDSFGVLRMTLHATSYDWQFVDAAGYHSTDSGTASCHVVQPTINAPATVLRGQPLVVSGTGRALTPVTLTVSNTLGTQSVVVRPDASGSWSATFPTTPDGGTYHLSATSGTQTSLPATSTMTGTTITGPAMAARGSHVVLSGLAEPGRTVVVYVTRPAAKPLAFKTSASAAGSYSVTVPVDADAGWYAVSNAYKTPKGSTLTHGVTISGPAKAGLKKAFYLSGLAAPRAKVTVYTRSYHGKTAIGHVVHANVAGRWSLKTAFAISSTWWAVSAGARSPIHTTLIPAPAKKPAAK